MLCKMSAFIQQKWNYYTIPKRGGGGCRALDFVTLPPGQCHQYKIPQICITQSKHKYVVFKSFIQYLVSCNHFRNKDSVKLHTIKSSRIFKEERLFIQGQIGIT